MQLATSIKATMIKNQEFNLEIVCNNKILFEVTETLKNIQKLINILFFILNSRTTIFCTRFLDIHHCGIRVRASFL